MNDKLHRHLDGELPADALEPDDRDTADEWERMVSAFRTSAPESQGAPPWLEQRVMADIEALPERGVLARALQWLVHPAPVRVPPLAVVGAVGALAALLVLPRGGIDTTPEDEVAGQTVESVVYVQFVLEAPSAQSVAVAGDFSEWEPEFALEDADGDGIWTGRVPVRPGVHSYMFLIDGTSWQTDPRADRYQDDGFGNRNAVLAVAAGA